VEPARLRRLSELDRPCRTPRSEVFDLQVRESRCWVGHADGEWTSDIAALEQTRIQPA